MNIICITDQNHGWGIVSAAQLKQARMTENDISKFSYCTPNREIYALREIFCEDSSEEPELCLLGIVQALMNGRHDLHTALKQCHSCPYGHVSALGTVTNLLIGDRYKATTTLNQRGQQLR